MIRIDPKGEPDYFDEKIRQRGQRFLARNPSPTQQQWKKHSYWRECSRDLHDRYGGICAYSCHWIAFDTGWRQVEHFKPKDRYPNLGYEWSNFRLVCGLLNGRKGLREIMDPFEVEDGWFTINFPSLLVKASRELSVELQARVEKTRDILGLNDEATCLKSRARYIEDFCRNRIPFEVLIRDAPFLAKELQRQDLVDRIREIMGFEDDSPSA